jgi:hypothetical protein
MKLWHLIKEGVFMINLKTLFLTLLIVVLSFATVMPQTRIGDKELSLSATFMSRKAAEEKESYSIFNMPVRVGFLVTNGTELEPELILSSYKDKKVGYILSGNIVYNVNPSDPNLRWVPFVLGGFGFANSELALVDVATPGTAGELWTTLNFGAGVKIFLSKPVALRIEYRYHKFFKDTDVTFQNIYVGFSIFFK